MKTKSLSIILFTIFTVFSVSAQTTEFTYQGVLNNGATPASGNYDFEFRLFDTLAGGTQLGSTITRAGVAIADGRFSVILDFGSQFPGVDRYLEIRVRTAGSGGYTILDPRQKIRSSPYAIKSANADSLGGVPASQYVTSPTGNAGFIQNTTVQQPASNFNISGNGYAGGSLDVGDSVNVGNAFKIGGVTVLKTIDQDNLFVGRFAGYSGSGSGNSFFGTLAGYLNSLGVENSFFGRQAGQNNQANLNSFFGARAGLANTDGAFNSFFGGYSGAANVGGNYNSFFGKQSGYSNTSGSANSFFGIESGLLNTTASDNSFFGAYSGKANTQGSYNSFFGSYAGAANTAGTENVFLGYEAGFSNTTGAFNFFGGLRAGRANTVGSDNVVLGYHAGYFNISGARNTFVGKRAGDSNATGSWNTLIGYDADLGSGALNNATAIGNAAYVTESNSLVLGSIIGINGAGASTNVGIGTTAPKARLHIVGGSIFIAQPNSLIITSPNGACWFITVNNSGGLGANPVTCP